MNWWPISSFSHPANANVLVVKITNICLSSYSCGVLLFASYGYSRQLINGVFKATFIHIQMKGEIGQIEQVIRGNYRKMFRTDALENQFSLDLTAISQSNTYTHIWLLLHYTIS